MTQDNNQYSVVTGIVEDVVFQNSANSFTVIDVSSSGELITAVGALPEIAVGEKVVLTGIWKTHPSFGRQLSVERFERYLPDTAAQYLKYLSSGAIKGIGPKTAANIVERFGENTFEVIEREPERLTFIKGISKDKAQKISAEFKKQFAVRTVILGLEKYELVPSECIRIFKRLGVNASQIVEDNPYVLCGQAGIISFERAEKIASMLPSPPMTKYRIRAGIEHIIRHNLINGHTCVPADRVLELGSELLGLPLEEISQCAAEMLDNRMLASFTKKDREFFALIESLDAESAICEKLLLLKKFSAGGERAAEKIIDEIEKKNKIRYEEKQRRAIMLAASEGALILTGGPGTGKTTAVKGIISYFERKNASILLAAPTGRAAKRMSELTGYEAKTVHRLLEVEWSDSDEPSFKRDSQNPLDADVVILDEVSMLDIFLFSSLLDAVRLGCKLILVGDSDQLPAVGAGNVLGDMIASGCVPVVTLTEIFRQSRQSLIVTNAHDVIEGKMPVLDDKSKDFFFLNRPNAVTAAETVTELCASRLPKAYGYSPLMQIQALCPSRKGDCGTINMNRRLQQALNPPSEGKTECTYGGRLFRSGDKIMQTKNNYDIPWERSGETGSGLFNGDIGIIEHIDLKTQSMTIVFDDDKTVSYPISGAAELELAYAVTVHKSQGSEYDAVVMPVCDAPAMLLYRNLFYTAITRAKRLMVLVGSREKISRMVENNRQNKRYSMLREMLVEADKNGG